MSLGFRLLAITPPVGEVDPGLVRAWEAARSVGLAVLLREPGVGPCALVSEGHRLGALRRACGDAEVPCLVSVDASAVDELAAALDATEDLAGAQVRGDPDEAALDAVRAVLGPDRRLGRSCHGRPTAMGPRVDYSVFAPVFAPRTTSPLPGPGKVPVGLDPLRDLTARERHVFALGGVTVATARACVGAGAYGLASIRSFFGPADEVRDNVARLVDALAEPARDAPPPQRSR